MITPPEGWYPNPEGEGLRFWDGSAWTDQYRQAMREPRDRPNGHAIAWSAAFGVVTYVGLLIFVNPRLDGSASYGAGRLLVPALVASVLMGVIARAATRRLGWWIYALAVPAGATAMALLLTLDYSDDALHVSTRRDSTGACNALLPKADAEALIGTDLDDPQTVTMDELSICGWEQSDNGGKFAAGSIEATEWAQIIPKAVAALKQHNQDMFRPEQLRIIERRLAQGLPATNAEACSMFRALVALQYPDAEKGSDSVVSLLPDTQHPILITAQSCIGGRFRTMVWTRTSGIPVSDELTDKFLDAVVALD